MTDQSLPQFPVTPPPAVYAPDAVRVGAGFWRRLGGYLIDGFLLAVGWMVVGLLLHIVGGGMLDSLTGVASLLMALAYFPFMESSEWQATLGKRALGMRVVDDHGYALTLGRALGRYVAAALNWVTFGIGYIMVGVREDKRGLHDMIAHTQVVLDDPSHPETPMLAWVVIGLYSLVMVGSVLLALVVAFALSGIH